MSERSAVQDPMLKYADAIGWKSVSRSEAMQMRRGEDRALLRRCTKNTTDETQQRYTGRISLPRKLCGQLNLLGPTLEGNQDALSWLRGEESVFVPDEDRYRNVTLIDYDIPDNNLFSCDR